MKRQFAEFSHEVFSGIILVLHSYYILQIFASAALIYVYLFSVSALTENANV